MVQQIFLPNWFLGTLRYTYFDFLKFVKDLNL